MIELPRGLNTHDLLQTLKGYEEKNINNEREFISLQKKYRMSNQSINYVYQLIMLGFEYEDTYVIPEYQRNLVWKKSQKQELINSIFTGNPIGDFLVKKVEKKDGVAVEWHIIDGQQRIEAIREFFMNKFPLKDGKYFKDLKYWDARDFLESYKINVWCVEKISLEQEIEIYLNRNCGGTTHTKKEIDKAKNFIK